MENVAETLYSPGDQVKVREDSPPRHHRTPWYVKGKTGRISVVCGPFHNPETRAYGGSGLPRQPLYRVEFDQANVWEGYASKSSDKIYIDIYQHWLESA